MVHSDTIIGIVGAVVLVAVMVGVFVYEYNNVETDGGDFAARFPGLDPDGDLDGDGITNAMDDDIDGDGTPNADDATTTRAFSDSGALGPNAPSQPNAASFPIAVEAGAQSVIVSATVTLDDPLGFTSGFTVELRQGDTVLDSDSGDGAFSLEAIEPTGDLQIVFLTDTGSLGGSFSFDALVQY